MFLYKCCCIFGLALLFSVGNVQASVTLSGTRIIYHAEDREVTVDMNNQSSAPALMQAWLDSGDSTVAPGVEVLPFIVMPPLSRVEANEGQTLRIAFTGGTLPTDRESVYWLNVLEIPAKNLSTKGKNVLRMAFRSRIKLFYRPADLGGSSYDVAKHLKWSVVKSAGTYVLRAENTDPYYSNIASITLKANGKSYVSEHGGMIDPLASKDFTLTGLSGPISNAKIEFKWLNDFGIAQDQSAVPK